MLPGPCTYPRGQALQIIALDSSEYVEPMQFLQLLDPASFAKVPVAQGKQRCSFFTPTLSEYRPLLQSLHWFSLFNPTSFEYLPSLHSLHLFSASNPISLEYRPELHSVLHMCRKIIRE